jgi:hypothetical protein
VTFLYIIDAVLCRKMIVVAAVSATLTLRLVKGSSAVVAYYTIHGKENDEFNNSIAKIL